jgi:hypothetical protein
MPDQAIVVGCNHNAPRRAVTRNLPGTEEEPSAGYVSSVQAPKQAEDDQLNEIIDALNERHERDGLLSDEFPSL